MRFFGFVILLLWSISTSAQKAPYQLQLDAGFQFSEAYVPSFSIQLFNGIQIPDWNAEAGITAGFDRYEQLDLFPLAIGVKWLPEINREWTPYLGLNAGIAIAGEKDLGQFRRADGGSLISPFAGIRFNKSHLIKWNVNLAFKVQKAKITSFDGIGEVPEFVNTDKYTFRRVFLGIGFSF